MDRLHGVKFQEKYKNWVACQDFICATRDYLFSEFVKTKPECTSFIGFLSSGTVDAATIEQKVLYLTLTQTLIYKLCLAYLKVVELESQDAQYLKNV